MGTAAPSPLLPLEPLAPPPQELPPPQATKDTAVVNRGRAGRVTDAVGGDAGVGGGGASSRGCRMATPPAAHCCCCCCKPESA
jgi:hypothetical protein